MKNSRQCPKCDSRRIFHLSSVADTARSTSNPYRPRTIAFTGNILSQEGVAHTEAYACANCGYFEEYIKNPHDVPWKLVVGATPLVD